MSFGQRIKEYIDYKGVSVRSFEMKSSLKNGAIYRVIKNGTSLNGDSITSLSKEWKDLNLNWLMKGEGEMLIDAPVVKEPIVEYHKATEKEDELSWCKEALKRADEHIALQKEMIDTLKKMIDMQKKSSKEAGIDL